jgi:hypothetical protein
MPGKSGKSRKSRKSGKMKVGGWETLDDPRPLTQSPYAAGLNQPKSYNPLNWVVATPRPGDYAPLRADEYVGDYGNRMQSAQSMWNRRPIYKWQGPPIPSMPSMPNWNMPRFTRRNQQSWPQRQSTGGKNKSRKNKSRKRR